MEEFYSYKEKTLQKRQSRETKYNTTKKRKYRYNGILLFHLLNIIYVFLLLRLSMLIINGEKKICLLLYVYIYIYILVCGVFV